jgi:hypothetical protein
MALPEQIRKQTEAVQQLYQQMSDEQSGDQQEGADENFSQEDQTTTEADLSANNEDASNPPEIEQTTGGKRKKKGEESETIEQKYRTLQGMFNAEVPRLQQQNKQLVERVQQLEQLLSTMSTATAAKPFETSAEKLVSEKDVEEYGESIDVMRKVSREENLHMAQRIAQLEEMLKRVNADVVPQIQTLSQKQAATTEQQFWARLSATVPNWKQINDNADFQTWLLQPDPLTGISRQTILEDAQRNYDIDRISKFFSLWMDTTGQANVAQNTQRDRSASELERQVAPGRGRGTAASSGAGESKTYSRSDIQAFFDAVRQGRYKGKEADRDRIERDIFAAQREGRIVDNA